VSAEETEIVGLTATAEPPPMLGLAHRDWTGRELTLVTVTVEREYRT
jgi:hypothetical protein